MSEVLIRPLVPDLGEDFLDFFDHAAFTDNPDWAGCYCQFYLEDPLGKPWDNRTGRENRLAAVERIAAGEMPGYLAFLDEKAVGFCCAAPRRNLPLLAGIPELAATDADQVGSVVCFIVAPRYRGQGIAAALLQAACQGLWKAGIRWVEAYPRIGTSEAAANCHGPLQMYLDAGFKTVKEFPGFQLVRKEMN